MSGPLSGLRVIEMAGIGPAPFCGMMLADHGAEVVVIHRPGAPLDPRDPLARSRRGIALDLKKADDVGELRRLVAQSDGLIEGFRPGVMERLGLGPDILLAENPKLVYGRMTGWGQSGVLAPTAGHDINYIAISGALHAFGRAGEKPTPPINIVGDFGGGGLLLAFSVVSALLNVRLGGAGQVIDCAMTDGSALLMSMIWGMKSSHGWSDERGTNLLDTGAPFYDTYETSDGKFVALGALEPQFYAQFRKLCGLHDDESFDAQMEPSAWTGMRSKLTSLFLTKTRDEWCALMNGTDACFAPVLSMAEAPHHPHNRDRHTFTELDGVLQPAPAPRYSATMCDRPRTPIAGESLTFLNDRR